MSNKTALFSNAQPGGVYVIADAPEHPGNIWFVDSGHDNKADSAGAGGSPDRPLATIDYAIGLCTASNGDVIYVAPGHAETLTAAITCDVAGVKIVGLGEGALRPQLTVAANGIDGITVTADNVTIENLYFNEATVASAAANINIAADSCTVRRVHMDMGANDRDGFTITAAGERPTIEDCTAKVTANGPDTWITFEGVIDRPIVRRNIIIASDGTDPFDDHILDFGGLAITNPIVIDNVFDGADQAVNSIDDAGAVVGDVFSGNRSGGSAVDGDTVTTAVAALADGGLTAAKVAAAAIEAAAFAADALAAFEAEAEDALEGENLDHLAKTATAGADMTTEVTDGSILSRILTATADTSDYDASTDSLEALANAMERCVEKSDGAVLNGQDDLFTITGGPVYGMLTGVVTTIIGGAANCHIDITTTEPASDTALSTDVAIDNDAAGTSYRFVGASGVLTPVTAGAVIVDPVTVADCWFLLPIGTIKAHTSAAQTGNIKWYLRYKPLSPNSVVVAAA